MEGLLGTHIWGKSAKPEFDDTTCEITREGDGTKFIRIEASPDMVQEIPSRSVHVKFVFEVLAEAENFDGLVKRTRECVDVDAFQTKIEAAGSFAFVCDAYGKSFTLAENVAKMNAFQFLFKMTHRADLNKPGLRLAIFEDQNRAFFGEIVAGSPKDAQWKRYHLPERPVLGPTTLDNELAFLMANMVGLVTLIMPPPGWTSTQRDCL